MKATDSNHIPPSWLPSRNALTSIAFLALSAPLQASNIPQTPNPSTWVTNGVVYAVASDGVTTYIGGSFSTVASSSGSPSSIRMNIAALDAATGAVLPWNPDADGAVYALLISGSSIYVGGDFLNIGSDGKARLAKVDRTTGMAVGTFNPQPNGTVFDLDEGAGQVFACGGFTIIGTHNRNFVAGLDPNSGGATTFNCGADAGPIYAVEHHGGAVYLGGVFTVLSGVGRPHLGAVNDVTGNALSWNPNADDTVRTFFVSPGTPNILYVGGDFSQVAGVTRNRLAALDMNIDTSNALAWDPNALGGVVRSMVGFGGTAIVGGNFTTVGGLSRSGLAQIDLTTSATINWNPNPNGEVNSVALSFEPPTFPTSVYAGGAFTTMGGGPQQHFAEFSPVTTVSNWTEY